MKSSKLKQGFKIRTVYLLIVNSILKITKRFAKILFDYDPNQNKPKESAFQYCKRTGVSYEKLRGIAYGQGRVWLPELTEEQKKELER